MASDSPLTVPDSIELTIVIPCLDEAETIARCIEKARLGVQRAGVRGEILFADNGSKDDSVQIAERLGARVVHVYERGYGSALRGGIQAASGKWILMGDADDSYDFSEAERFVRKLQDGFELVMGCRLPSGGGKILPGAMPWKNRWLGNPVLSFIGRLFFKCPAHDFHCGMRGFTKAAFQKMDLRTTGMEFASEMVIKSTFKALKIAEVPVTLHKDGRSRSPHLKPWRDGWRHVRFMLLFSPRWLFLLPGIFLFSLGLILAITLSINNVQIGTVELNVGTLTVACMTVAIGFQLIVFAFFTKVFAIAEGLLPDDPKFSRLFKFFTLEKGIVFSLAALIVGCLWLARALWIWKSVNYGVLPSMEENLRRLIPAVTLVVLGIESLFSSFFMSALGLKTASRRPPSLSETQRHSRKAV
jgi:glycosyltransferase involved in cell wall biosynthesis